MDKLILQMTCKILDEYASELVNHGCNDYEIDATHDNIMLVKDMIAKSDYPEDEPHIWNNQIHFMDFQLVYYLKQQLMSYLTRREDV